MRFAAEAKKRDVDVVAGAWLCCHGTHALTLEARTSSLHWSVKQVAPVQQPA
jgi:hypothetical protein